MMLIPGRKITNGRTIRNTKSSIKLRSMMDHEVNSIKDTIKFDTIKYFVDNMTHEFLVVYMTKPMEYYQNRELLHVDYIIKVDLFVKDSDVYTKFVLPGPEYDIKLRDSADLKYKEITYRGEKILEIRKDMVTNGKRL